MEKVGLRIVTDLHFWRTSRHWQSNVNALLEQNAVFVEGVNAYTARRDLFRLSRDPFGGTCIPLTAQTIGLVVFAGFYPHQQASTALQALTAQFPKADALVLYAARDRVPSHQEDFIHIQTWTADSHTGFEIRAGSDGTHGPSRCWSSEIQSRGLQHSPELVKVSAFVRHLSHVALVDGRISTTRIVQMHLTKSHVLFLCEGDAALAKATLHKYPSEELHKPTFHIAKAALTNVAEPATRWHPSGWCGTYQELIEHIYGEGGDGEIIPEWVKDGESAARFWQEAWPHVCTDKLCDSEDF